MLERNTTVILVIDSLEIGGAEKSILELQKRIQRKHEVKLVLFKGRASKPNGGEKIVCIESSRIFSFTTIFGMLKEIRSLRSNKTIFISFAPEVAVLVNFALMLSHNKRNSRSIVSFRNSPKYYGAHSKVYQFLLHFAAVNFCDACHFLTRSNATEYSELFPRFFISKNKKKFIIPNYLRNYQDLQNAPKDKSLIIFVGRLTSQKQPLHFIRFVKILEQVYPNKYQYKILGDGDLKQVTLSQIQKEKLSEKISVLGKVENISKYYSDASYMINTSDYEGHPGAIFEAIQSGVRVISYPYDDWICEIFSKLHCSHTSTLSTPESLLQTFLAQENNTSDEKVDIDYIENFFNQAKLTTSWLRLIEQV